MHLGPKISIQSYINIYSGITYVLTNNNEIYILTFRGLSMTTFETWHHWSATQGAEIYCPPLFMLRLKRIILIDTDSSVCVCFKC